MLKDIDVTNILFLDIETVPLEPDFDALLPHFKDYWEKKSSSFRGEDESASDAYPKAGLYAEFGKVICISVGIITKDEKKISFRVKSFYGEDEKKLLQDFARMISQYSGKRNIHLCAHNGKNFDFPILSRRMVINEVELPDILDITGKKPWDLKFLDTMEIWKFGDYRHFVSLDLLAELLGIETPKEEMNGSMVSDVYWKEKDLDKIARYCEQDVLCVAQLVLKFKRLDPIPPENVQSIRE